MSNHQEHEFVDLGLPSGTLWATCNVGANKPEDYGDYLSWDEGKTVDAKWGNGWQMPSKEQWEELVQNTKTIWTTRNGVNGRLFIANNGNSIFLPAAGYLGECFLYGAGSFGNYWSSSLDTNHPSYARGFRFHSSDTGMGGDYRTYGRPGRAVRKN